MRNSLLVSAFLAAALYSTKAVSADSALPGEMTKVDATYRCETRLGGVAFRVPEAESSARVWQTNPGEELGLEFEVESFETYRCVGCYGFKARIDGMAASEGSTRMVNGKVVLEYRFVDLRDASDTPFDFTFPCVASP